jgi:hypothetical protein
MNGDFGERILDFGKWKRSALAEVPDYSLRWYLDQDWFEVTYPQWVEPFEDELKWRDAAGVKVGA